jgi:alkylated DNA repair dioxygenase AlkB
MDLHDEIPGLYYIPNYLTQEEGKILMDYLINSTEWQDVWKPKSRKVIQYGYSYPYYKQNKLEKTKDIPQMFKDLLSQERVNALFGKEILSKPMDQLIINRYLEKESISAHIDHVKYFGDTICCISLGSPTFVIFKKDEKSIEILLEPNSMYIMTSDARYKFTHELKQEKGTRISLTFRTVI